MISKSNKGKNSLYGRTDMVLVPSDKVYGSLGLHESYLLKSVEGYPPVIMDNCIGDKKLQFLDMQGWTKQNQYEGKNLFNLEDILNTEGHVDSNFSKSISITPFDVVAGEKYVVIGKGRQLIAEFYSSIYFGESDLVYNQSDKSSVVLDTGTGFAFFKNGEEIRKTVTANRSCTITNVIIHGQGNRENAYEVEELGVFHYVDGNEKYEPYTGGAPSPSPDYPQEIVSAGDYNEETDKYEYEIKVTGKNILSIPDITPSTPERTIACNITRDITISAQEVPISISSNIWRLRMKYLDGTLLYFADVEFLSLKPKTFYASEENPIIAITYRETYITEGRYGGIQVEYGTSATEYQPFTEQTITLTSDRPLTEWDRLVEKDGKWQWEYNSKEIVLDGSDDESWRIFSKVTTFFIELSEMKSGLNMDGWCDCFVNIKNTGAYGMTLGQKNKFAYFAEMEKHATSIPNWRTWLQSNPINVLFETESPEYIPLQESEQQELNALKTYYPTTVFSNDQDMYTKISYQSFENR